MTASFDPITLEILWNRLIAIVDEASATLVRTSFSTVVRESNDFACVLMDAQGNSLAQSSISIPSFIGTLPITVKHFLREYPAETLRPGDILITNDPWLGTGHLHDINMALPIFRDGRLIAIAASVAHAPDIGGRIRSADNREVFEEGLRIPVSKLYWEGRPNEELLRIIYHNVRGPDQVIGDLRAQIAANELAARRLLDLMKEYGLEELTPLAQTIHAYSEGAMRRAIAQIPPGDYYSQVQLDGYSDPLTIRLKLSVLGDRIVADYTGTSPQIDRGLNVVPNYTFAYTAFPIKCLTDPAIPNNEGCFRAIEVTAPLGCLLNPRFPAAVGARAMTGHFLPAAVFSALAQAIPHRVQAPSGSPLWSFCVAGVDERYRSFASLFFFNGGQGASARKDGISCLSFPSNISNTPVEVIENIAPVRIERKEMRPDSGGPGRHRGGCGQTFVVRCLSPQSLTLVCVGDRTKFPAPGLLRGREGALGAVLFKGVPINPKEQRVIRGGDQVVLMTPGGGGFGDPKERGLGAVLADVINGLVSPAQARAAYGIDPTQHLGEADLAPES